MGNPEGTFDTTLHEAVRCNDLDDVKVALRHGYDPNLIGLFQWSSLHEAAYNGNADILKLLLEKKGDPNKPDYIQQKTAMHYATEQGHIDCLKLLVAAGGRYDLQDDTGRDCLDMATPAGRKILEKLKVRDIMLNPVEEVSEVTHGGQPADDQSSLPDSQSSSRRSSLSQSPALGYLHMSVEYHAAKSTMKVRVWQVTDLLLPPPNTSMIYSIYVKSYLVPDKKKDSKRKTEEIRVDNSEGYIHWKKQQKTGIQHVFKPSNFTFVKPLEYSGIKPETIKDKHMSIEVCITQKYSHRSFLVGMVNMSLKSAVKKIVKEKMPLIPCMNHTIPSTMKVYSASELTVTDAKVFYSNPNFSMAIPDDFDRSSTKAASNPNLQSNKYSSSTEVDMNHEYRTVPHVPKLDLNNQALDESGYSSEFHVSFPGDIESPDSDSHSSFKVVGKNNKASTGEESTAKVISVLEGRNTKTAGVTRYHRGIPTTDLDEEEEELMTISTESHVKIKQTEGKTHTEHAGSRPETPTWDYYDMPTEVVTLKEKESSSPWQEGAAPVVLPMTTTLQMLHPGEGCLSIESQQDKPKKKSVKKSKMPKPGTAIPLLPEIIITNAEKDIDVGKSNIVSALEMTSVIIEKPLPVKSEVVAIETKQNVNKEQTSKVKERSNSVDWGTMNYEGEAIAKPKPQGKAVKEKSKLLEKLSKSSFKAKLKKLRKTKESESRSDKRVPMKVTGHTEKSPRLPGGAVCVAETEHRDVTPREGSTLARKDSEVSSNASFIIDMDSLSFASSDSHVVELENDVSITELPENSQLFSHMSESSIKFSDIESGMDYELPERVSPTKYMIPMQVYMDDDDTSCDESLTTDMPNEPTTEL